MTLFQQFINWLKRMYNSKFGKPVEFGFWNPARAKIRDGVAITTINHQGKDYYLDSIREYTRTYRGEKVVHTVYVLSHQPLGGKKETVRLMYMPLAEQDARGRDYVILLLTETDSMAYEENLHNALYPSRENKPDKGEFQVFEDDGVTLLENWWRVDDQRGPINANVAVVKARRDGGKIEAGDIVREDCEYWDFNRDVDSEGGVKFKQYQFYEMRKRDHWMWGYRGEEVDAEQVVWNFI
jgi:hypothetical protein